MKMKQLKLQQQKQQRLISKCNIMCGVKLQWWADAFENDEAENKDIALPTQTEDKESNC